MEVKPFSKAYVLRATAKHMRKCVDISIRKTNERWPEFKDDPEASKVIVETLMKLHDMRALLDSYQKLNSDHFKEVENGKR